MEGDATNRQKAERKENPMIKNSAGIQAVHAETNYAIRALERMEKAHGEFRMDIVKAEFAVLKHHLEVVAELTK